MQFKIEGSNPQLQDLATQVFNEYPQHIQNNKLCILTELNDDSDCLPFLSMVKAFTKQPVIIDYMSQNIIKFVIL